VGAGNSSILLREKRVKFFLYFSSYLPHSDDPGGRSGGGFLESFKRSANWID
jgi:hypothetical protein